MSQAAGMPWVNISQAGAVTAASNACSGCHLITEAEWLTIAHNVVNVDNNWSGGSVGSGYMYRGHNDFSPNGALEASTNDNDGYFGTGNTGDDQRRTLQLSNGEIVWDLAGNVYDWTTGQTSGGQPGDAGSNYYTWYDWHGEYGPELAGSLPSPNPYPNFGTPAAINWTYQHGIGDLLSNPMDTSLRGYMRGGWWYVGVNAGVLMLSLEVDPTATDAAIGFRIAK